MIIISFVTLKKLRQTNVPSYLDSIGVFIFFEAQKMIPNSKRRILNVEQGMLNRRRGKVIGSLSF